MRQRVAPGNKNGESTRPGVLIVAEHTSRDLAEYRKQARNAIESLDDYRCIAMENFGARDQYPGEVCRTSILECDLYVGIIGPCYGSLVHSGAPSYTEFEYGIAQESGKPMLVFCTKEDFPLPAHLRESDELNQRQRAFRARVMLEHVVASFSSPANFAVGVGGAIRNWENGLEKREKQGSAPATDLEPLPPEPWVVHPYPLQKNFAGRQSERHLLTDWFTKGPHTLLSFTAIGGMGKSALTWVWTQSDLLGRRLSDLAEEDQSAAVPIQARPDGFLWWSFYESGATLPALFDALIRYGNGRRQTHGASTSTQEKLDVVLRILTQRRWLLVLDGFERELVGYASLDAPYLADGTAIAAAGISVRSCMDPHAQSFLRKVVSLPLKSRVLLTTRLFPEELEGLAGARNHELKEMDSGDVLTFFKAQGMRGSHSEFYALGNKYGHHPLAVRLLAGMISNDPVNPLEVTVANEYDPVPRLIPREHHVLDLAFRASTPAAQLLLSRIEAFRAPVGYDAVKAISPSSDVKELRRTLQILIDRGLLLLDTDRKVYDLHPIVRSYAYDRLTEKGSVHLGLRNYFSALPKPTDIDSADQLSPVVELYHHTVHAGLLDEALDLFRERLEIHLYDRFGLYHKCIELLKPLFVNGEANLPPLRDFNLSWATNTLANCQSYVGNSFAAAALYDLQNRWFEDKQQWRNLAVSLGSLADEQIKRGELGDAERSLNRRVQLGGTNDYLTNAYFARFYTYVGQFNKAKETLGVRNDIAKLDLGWFNWYTLLTLIWVCLISDDLDLAATCVCAIKQKEKDHYGFPDTERDNVWKSWLLGALFGRLFRCGSAALANNTRVDLHRDFEIKEKGEVAWKPLIHFSRRHRGKKGLPNFRDVALTRSYFEIGNELIAGALLRSRRGQIIEFQPDMLLSYAELLMADNRLDDAREAAERSLEISKASEYRFKQAEAYLLLANIELECTRYSEAKIHVANAEFSARDKHSALSYKRVLERAAHLRTLLPR